MESRNNISGPIEIVMNVQVFIVGFSKTAPQTIYSTSVSRFVAQTMNADENIEVDRTNLFRVLVLVDESIQTCKIDNLKHYRSTNFLTRWHEFDSRRGRRKLNLDVCFENRSKNNVRCYFFPLCIDCVCITISEKSRDIIAKPIVRFSLNGRWIEIVIIDNIYFECLPFKLYRRIVLKIHYTAILLNVTTK